MKKQDESPKFTNFVFWLLFHVTVEIWGSAEYLVLGSVLFCTTLSASRNLFMAWYINTVRTLETEQYRLWSIPEHSPSEVPRPFEDCRKTQPQNVFQGLLRLVQGDSLQKRVEEINHWHRWYEVGNYFIHRSIYSYFDQLVTLPPWPSVRHRNPTALSSLNCRQWLSVCFWPIIYSYKFTSFFSAVFDSHQFLCSLIHFGNSFEINHLIIISLYSLTNQNGDSRSATTHIFTTSRPIINFTVLDIGAVYVSASVP